MDDDDLALRYRIIKRLFELQFRYKIYNDPVREAKLLEKVVEIECGSETSVSEHATPFEYRSSSPCLLSHRGTMKQS